MNIDSSEAAIEIKGLKKTYKSQGGFPEKEALKGIDLSIPRGSIFGLLGPNGAGKSTMINILAGLVVKSSGSVKIWGFDQDTNPRMSRASIGVVPQELHIDPFFSPRAALEVQAGLYGVPKSERRTDEILAVLGLSDKADAYARTLSGGMLRRLLVAKAMVHTPAVLVLDEPTAGVDIELRRQLWDYVRDLNERGTTIILTTHYLEEAEEMCDRIAIINQGQVIANEDKVSLLARIDRKTLLVTPNASLSHAPMLADDITADLRKDGVICLTYAGAKYAVPDLLEKLHAADIQIKDISTAEANLEDIFLSLTG